MFFEINMVILSKRFHALCEKTSLATDSTGETSQLDERLDRNEKQRSE